MLACCFAGRRFAVGCCLLPALLAFSGSAKTDPPQFHLNRVELVRQEVPENHQEAIADVLQAMFGTPDQPHVVDETGLDPTKFSLPPDLSAAMPAEHIRTLPPALRALPRNSGDGMGRRPRFLKPYPRDYRQGKFKFKRPSERAKPTTKTSSTFSAGIPGTAMPSFVCFPPRNRGARRICQVPEHARQVSRSCVYIAEIQSSTGGGIAADARRCSSSVCSSPVSGKVEAQPTRK